LAWKLKTVNLQVPHSMLYELKCCMCYT